MHPHSLPCTLLVIALGIATWATTVGGQYSITVNQERLVNAQNEPQNWLLMNGDYGSQRFSKLTAINRDNVGQLRMVWALALGGMQDTGQNGPEAETNPLVDNGFMYTSDGWGTVYKFDARQPNRRDFVWVADPGVAPRRQHFAHPRHCALGGSRPRQSPGWPRSSLSIGTTARSSGTLKSRGEMNSATGNGS